MNRSDGVRFGRHLFAAVAIAMALAAGCGDGLRVDTAVRDIVRVDIGEVVTLEPLRNDAVGDTAAVVAVGAADEADLDLVNATVVSITGRRSGTRDVTYTVDDQGNALSGTITIVVATATATFTRTATTTTPPITPTATPSPTATPITPTPTTPPITPCPSRSFRSGDSCVSITVACASTNAKSGQPVGDAAVAIREWVNWDLTVEPADAPITVQYDHGDGTIEEADDDLGANGLYLSAGTYFPTLQWRLSATDNWTSVPCGSIEVAPDEDEPDDDSLLVSCVVDLTTVKVGLPITATATFTDLAGLTISFETGETRVSADVNERTATGVFSYEAAKTEHEVTVSWNQDGSEATETERCGFVEVLDCSAIDGEPPKVCQSVTEVTCSVEESDATNDGITLTTRGFQVTTQISPAGTTFTSRVVRANGFELTLTEDGYYFLPDPGTFSITVDWKTEFHSGTRECGSLEVQELDL